MKKFNVYDLMKSAEIREYLRAHKVFTLLEQEQIIINSYYPIEEKISMFHRLAGQAAGEEQARIEKTAEVLSAALEELYYPIGKELYALNIYSFDRLQESDGFHLFKQCHGICDIYDSFEDILEECNKNEKKESALYYVDVIRVSDGGPSREIMDIQISYMDGRYRIWNIRVWEEWLKEHGMERDDVESLFGSHFRYSLPFKHGSRVKIQTPFMSKPLYGWMCSSRDGNGCWYHFFEGRRNGRDVFVDVSYGTLGIGGQFLVFDWLERVEKDKGQDMADITDIPDLAYPYERPDPISAVRKCGKYVIAGKVAEAEIVEREPSKDQTNKALRITVEDETGAISCYLTFDPSDNNCITELCGTQGKVVLSGMFFEDKNGHMYMDYETDTYIIP